MSEYDTDSDQIDDGHEDHDPNPRESGKWLSALIALLGLWMIGEALLLDLAMTQFWNDILVGALLLAAGGYNYTQRADEEAGSVAAAGLAALLGIWLIAAPFVLGAGAEGAPIETMNDLGFWNDVVVGLLAFVLGAYSAYKARKLRARLAHGGRAMMRLGAGRTDESALGTGGEMRAVVREAVRAAAKEAVRLLGEGAVSEERGERVRSRHHRSEWRARPSRESRSWGVSLTALLVGVAIGYVLRDRYGTVDRLTADASDRVGQVTDEAAEQSERVAGDAADRVRTGGQSAAERARHTSEGAADRVRESGQRASETGERIGERVEEGGDAVGDRIEESGDAAGDRADETDDSNEDSG